MQAFVNLLHCPELKTENRLPSRNRINAILQRLGLPDDRYYALVTPEELEIEALKKEIVACNALKRVEDGFDKISQLEKIVKPDDQITQQFILRSKVLWEDWIKDIQMTSEFNVGASHSDDHTGFSTGQKLKPFSLHWMK